MFQSIQPAHTTVSTSLHTLSKKWEYSHARTIKTRQWSFAWKGEGETMYVAGTGENGKKKKFSYSNCAELAYQIHRLTTLGQAWADLTVHYHLEGKPSSPKVSQAQFLKSHNSVAEYPLAHHTHLPKASLGRQRGFKYTTESQLVQP